MTSIKNFSDFVFENYPLYRIEEFNNGTAALLGFKNFADIAELESKFKNDDMKYMGCEFGPFNLYQRALEGEFCNGMHVEEVGDDKFSVTCDGCDEPFAIYDKKSVDYEFDGTTKQIGILFKVED